MFKGVYTALITPFTTDGAIDEPALRRIVNAQIDAGVAGLVPVGTTGESPTVTHQENIRVISIVIDEARGRVPVIAGTGSNSTAEAIDMTREAKKIGATATLQVAPYYNKPSQEGFYRHFTTIADTVDLPIMVYNIPGRTGKNIETDTLVRMAAHPNIVALKEASGSISQMMDVIARLPEDFSVLSGDDNLAFVLTSLGGQGVVSVASNLIPSRMVKLVDQTLQGEWAHARDDHYRLLPFFRALFLDTNPVPIKYMMHRAGFCENSYRLPMVPLSEENQRAIDALLTRYGIV
ncbi:4-hydroxy-tetrahydrodipicolinate synthase [Alkalispirochaeta sphaeroplastigenens]|uniref:4-hydroxy-tetrahydrodipicolinate synthase n=1 Tax=Alkalispirochaeta sphaeroplastigenens TaxID=1187066 RepID=A0A2S4K088_9SPIO|nr:MULTISPECIES: 4-hydroxy-tetrahydrodipicolinate synthase [Alkalispirochaeta]POR05177.1 4-hydroxy-tetrahydrodipicolinate synthase [Alkalispirochaeta sphaeroplastigenens]